MSNFKSLFFVDRNIVRFKMNFISMDSALELQTHAIKFIITNVFTYLHCMRKNCDNVL